MATTEDDKQRAERRSAAELSASLKESAQQIWLAGLGAFARAQEEGGKMFETLVKEGASLQRKTQTVAEERIAEATNRMASMASDISSKAAGQWDKLEGIFESRVAKAMNKLGVPTSSDIDALKHRLDDIERRLDKVASKPPTRRSAARPATRPAAKRAANRKPG